MNTLGLRAVMAVVSQRGFLSSHMRCRGRCSAGTSLQGITEHGIQPKWLSSGRATVLWRGRAVGGLWVWACHSRSWTLCRFFKFPESPLSCLSTAIVNKYFTELLHSANRRGLAKVPFPLATVEEGFPAQGSVLDPSPRGGQVLFPKIIP